MRFRNIRKNLPVLILGFIILGLSFCAISQKSIFAEGVDSGELSEGEHFVTIHNDGEDVTIRTNAQTVSEVLERAGVQYEAEDIIEPSLDEDITETDFNINIYHARDVMVKDGAVRKYIRTAASNPEEIIKAAQIEILPADIIEIVEQDSFLEAGATSAYELVRAKTINFTLYGQQLSVRSQAETIGDFLKEQNIESDPEVNWISLAEDTRVYDGIEFKVYMQGKQTFSQEEEIPFTEKTTQDFDMPSGKSEITKAGQNGRKMVTYEIELYNGEEISRQVISEIITQEPVQQERRVGIKSTLPSGSHEDWMAAAGISSSDYGYVEYIISRESGWSPMKYNYGGSGAYGLCQALPGSKMASAGSDWKTNPITQLRWCSSYATRKYGSWSGAYRFWINNHWW